MSGVGKVDISKIKPGDKVALVPLEVKDKFENTIYIAFPNRTGAAFWVNITHVAEHHPAPREFQVGDGVKWGETYGVVEHVARGKARVLWDEGKDDLVCLQMLTLVEAGQ